jgi:carbonic anhydrase
MSPHPVAALVRSIVVLAMSAPIVTHGADARRDDTKSAEPKRADSKPAESKPADLRPAEPKLGDADDAIGRPGSRRIDGISRKARELKASDEAIEQLSNRIVEKLAAMKAESAKNAPPPRLVIKARTSNVQLAYQRANGEPAGAASPSGARQIALAASPQVNAAALAAAHRKSVAAATVVADARGVAPAANREPHWSYAGENGPENWGRLKPEFAKCSNGSRQSPIDVREGIKVDLEPIKFDYRPSAFRVVDNGHTVQIGVAAGNSIQVMGRHFELVQFHFHRPSEERVDGRVYEMVAHLVHKDSEGRLAVVAVLIERGNQQAVIQTVWNNLPLEQGEELAAAVPIDPGQLLPDGRAYFTYMGSLTTPPCSESVLWMVLKQPIQASDDQLSIFARLYPMNARPVQSASGRLIKESN